MRSPDMFEMIFMNDKGDEEKLYKLFPDEVEAAYWADDTARQFQWTLIDVSHYGKKEVFS